MVLLINYKSLHRLETTANESSIRSLREKFEFVEDDLLNQDNGISQITADYEILRMRVEANSRCENLWEICV